MAWEGEKDFSKMQVSLFQVRRAKKKPFHQRELIYSVSEIARTLLVTPQSIYRYRRDFPDFPKLITLKAAVSHWASRHQIPMKRGPSPSYRRKQVVYMREKEGKTFRKIGQELGISHQAAYGLWKRHLRRN